MTHTWATSPDRSGTEKTITPGIDHLLDALIAREGGFVDHPADRGGPTKYGITQATLAAWRGRAVTPEDVAALSEAEARAIYRARYYEGPGIARLPEALQPVMLDAAVHMGPKRAVQLLQRLLAAAVGDVGGIDGVIGPRTIAASRAIVARCGLRAVALILLVRALDLARLIAADPTQRAFAAGWTRRLAALLPEEAADAAAALTLTDPAQEPE